MGKPVVMGRKTFLSLRAPLPGRTNIVMTRDANFQAAGVVAATSLDTARSVALGDALRRLATEIMVIGGADIYAQWIGIADRLEITEVHVEPAGDAYFQPVDSADWKENARARHSATVDDGADFSYVTYGRRRPH